MLYFIYAKEGMYEGLHGIYDCGLYNCNSYEDACSIGADLSYDVIESYIRPEDVYYTPEDYCEDNGYDEWRDEYESDYYEALDEICQDNLSYTVYEVKEGTTEEDYEHWLKTNRDPYYFIKNYCKLPTIL